MTVRVETCLVPACEAGRLACLRCGDPLDLHQPDGEFPDGLLGTCPDCGSWHLVVSPLGDGPILLVLLPTDSEVRAALEVPAASPS